MEKKILFQTLNWAISQGFKNKRFTISRGELYKVLDDVIAHNPYVVETKGKTPKTDLLSTVKPSIMPMVPPEGCVTVEEKKPSTKLERTREYLGVLTGETFADEAERILG